MPSRTFRRVMRSVVASSAIPSVLFLGRGDLALAQQRLDAGDLAADLRQARHVVELTGRVLEAQVEQLFLRLAEPVLELGVVELSELLGRVVRHGSVPQASSCRTTKRVLIGSLCIASRMASRAVASGTPDSSDITRPGFTTATQCPGLRLPEPMGLSAGFWVTGLSGKIVIQPFPPRLM